MLIVSLKQIIHVLPWIIRIRTIISKTWSFLSNSDLKTTFSPTPETMETMFTIIAFKILNPLFQNHGYNTVTMLIWLTINFYLLAYLLFVFDCVNTLVIYIVSCDLAQPRPTPLFCKISNNTYLSQLSDSSKLLLTCLTESLSHLLKNCNYTSLHWIHKLPHSTLTKKVQTERVCTCTMPICF